MDYYPVSALGYYGTV